MQEIGNDDHVRRLHKIMSRDFCAARAVHQKFVRYDSDKIGALKKILLDEGRRAASAGHKTEIFFDQMSRHIAVARQRNLFARRAL